jgi:serpin B
VKTRDSDVEAVVKANTAFSAALYKTLSETNINFCFSPYSISTALAMTFAGARENTAKQMAGALCYNLSHQELHQSFAHLQNRLKAIQERGSIQLHIANSIWPHAGYPFLEEFLALLKEYYGALISSVDYGNPETVREKINSWVKNTTMGKIQGLIPTGALTTLTRLVLSNAIYFKGHWLSRFEKTHTQNDHFWVTSEKRTIIPMMRQKQEFRYSETNTLQILEIPYKGDDVAFMVLLPKARGGLRDIEKKFSEETLRKWTRDLRKREIHVSLPKCTLHSNFRLDASLKSMGMTDAFDENKADFSGMDGIPNWLSISAIFHKVFIDLNEEGAEAAAATAVVMRAKGLPPSCITFCADHPFIFLIREKRSGSILFLGRMVDPDSEDASV